jgi:DNA-binding transcriptional MerR regulator
MSIVENGVTYLTVTEAAKELGISRQMFYQSIKPMLQAHQIQSRKSHSYYREDDIKALKTVQRLENLPIVVGGIQKNFEKYLQSLGYNVRTETLGVPALEQMNAEIAHIFQKPVGAPVVRRKRRLGVESVPYRIETTFYSGELAGGEILEAMQRDSECDVIQMIAEKHQLRIAKTHEIIRARLPNKEERRQLGIRATDPLLEVKRTSSTEDGQTILMFQDLWFVAGYFQLEYDSSVAHWNPE